jgi:hypothetical protein
MVLTLAARFVGRVIKEYIFLPVYNKELKYRLSNIFNEFPVQNI